MILTEGNEYSVVLDACVLVPMPLCDTLLRLAEGSSLYRPFWSDRILEEVGRALQEKLRHSEGQSQRRIRAMRYAFPEALVQLDPSLEESLGCIPDKDDRHVMACAIRCGAYAIVTSNTKDFPAGCLAQWDLVCQTPDDFLLHQFHLNADLVLEKLDNQGAAIGKERDYILERLRVLAPQFVALVEECNS
ncbi:MAG: PIN domain-containing protein [Terracidiphilus sp.]